MYVNNYPLAKEVMKLISCAASTLTFLIDVSFKSFIFIVKDIIHLSYKVKHELGYEIVFIRYFFISNGHQT